MTSAEERIVLIAAPRDTGELRRRIVNGKPADAAGQCRRRRGSIYWRPATDCDKSETPGRPQRRKAHVCLLRKQTSARAATLANRLLWTRSPHKSSCPATSPAARKSHGSAD